MRSVLLALSSSVSCASSMLRSYLRISKFSSSIACCAYRVATLLLFFITENLSNGLLVSPLWNLWNNLRLRACRQLLAQVVALHVQFLIRTYCSSVGTSLLRRRSCCSEMNCALAGQHPSWTRVVPILDPSGGSRLFQTCQRTRGGVHRSDWSAIRKT